MGQQKQEGTSVEQQNQEPTDDQISSYSGQTTNKRKSTFISNCTPILGNELCERLAYYGIATNLIIYLSTVMGEVSDQAASQVNLFEGMCYITPLIGALLADSYLGRFKTILVASSVYLLGMILLTLSASVSTLSPPNEDTAPTTFQFLFLSFSLAIIALGTGGIKPVVSVFGADQFDERDPKDKAEKASFFNWFYFMVNVGSLIAATVVVYIQENNGWALGFAIPTSAMFMAIVCFVSGYRRYKHAPTAESPITRVVKVVFTAIINRYKLRKYRRQSSNPEYQSLFQSDKENQLDQRSQNSQPRAPKKQKLQWLNWAMQDVLVDIPEVRQFDTKYKTFSYRQVEEVRLVLCLVPFFVYMIFYWLIYQQMTTFFVLQGEYMMRDFNIFGKYLRIPSASMSTFNTIGIIVLIPLYDQVVIPLLRKYYKPPTNLQRTGWGFVVAAIAMLYSAGIERWRLNTERKNLDLPPEQQKHLNIFWLAGGYLLVGLSEVLSSIGQIEFFYDQAPDAMRSTASALSLLSTAFGSFLASFLVQLIQKVTSIHGPGWVPKDLNQGRLDLFYVLCAGTVAVALPFFIWSSMNHESTAVKLIKQDIESEKISQQAQQDTSAQGVPILGYKYVEEDQYGRSVVVQPITPPFPNPLK